MEVLHCGTFYMEKKNTKIAREGAKMVVKERAYAWYNNSRYLCCTESVYSLEEGTMKAKSVFIFRSIIVIALAVVAVVAFMYCLPEISADSILCFPKAEVSPQDAMKILFLLFSVGSIIVTQIRNKNVFQVLAGIIYALAIAFLLGKWGIYMACAERGYEAVGGEYCLVFIVGQAAGTAIEYFFDSLGDVKYERTCRKEGS